MKPNPTLLLAAATLALCACKGDDSLDKGSRLDDPLYDGHWGVGSLGWRSSYHLFGYDPTTGESLAAHEQEVGRDLAYTIRRHLLNDDPTNPLQQRRGFGGDSPYNASSVVVDFVDIGREAVIGVGRGIGAALILTTDFVVGPFAALLGFDYRGISELVEDDASGKDPTPPREFRVKNR